MKFGTGAGAERIWARIFSEIAVDALRREQARSGDVVRVDAGEERRASASSSALRYALSAESFVVADVQVTPEEPRVERPPVGVVEPASDDEQVGRALVELLVASRRASVFVDRLPDRPG